jgi:hypothetical protein
MRINRFLTVAWIAGAVAGCSGGGSDAAQSDQQNEEATKAKKVPPFDGDGAGSPTKINGRGATSLPLGKDAAALVSTLKASGDKVDSSFPAFIFKFDNPAELIADLKDSKRQPDTMLDLMSHDGTAFRGGEETFSCRALSSKPGKHGSTLESRAVAFYRTTSGFVEVTQNDPAASERSRFESAATLLVKSLVEANPKATIFRCEWFNGDDTSIDGLVSVDSETGIVRSIANTATG